MAKTRGSKQVVATGRTNEGAASSNHSREKSPTPPVNVSKTAAKTAAPGVRAPPKDVAGGSRPHREKGGIVEVDYDSQYGPQAQLKEMADRLRRAEQERSELAVALQTLCQQIPQKPRRRRSPSSSGSASPRRHKERDRIEPAEERGNPHRSAFDRLGRQSALSRLGRRGNSLDRQEQYGRHRRTRSREATPESGQRNRHGKYSRSRELTPQSARRNEDKLGAAEIRDIMEDILDRRQAKDGHDQPTARQLVQRVTELPL